MHKEKKICDSIVQCPMCRKEFWTLSVKRTSPMLLWQMLHMPWIWKTYRTQMLYTTCGSQRRSKKKTKATLKRHRKKNPLASVWCFKFVYSFLWIAFCIVLRVVLLMMLNSGTFFKFGQCSFCILTIGYMIALLQGMHLLITHALDLGLLV